ncbi:MAG: hypothetical protein JWP01_2488 [Myxococcales bacterium]|nr:hypothetical protein [Myxococcales bacterium]
MGDYDDRDRARSGEQASHGPSRGSASATPGKSTRIEPAPDPIEGSQQATPANAAMAALSGVPAPSVANTQLKRLQLGRGGRRSPFALYLSMHGGGLGAAIREHFADTQWPDPAADVPFEAGGDRLFAAYLASSIRDQLDDGDAIPALLHPSTIVEQLRQFVPDLHRKRPWSPEFGRVLGQLSERAAIASLKSVGARYRSALAQTVRLPTADDLLASHPMDLLVARALTQPTVVDNSRVAQTEQRNKPVAVKAQWLGRSHPELWNFVKVTPATATTEDVAVAVWGDPKKAAMAFAIRKYGDVFRIAPSYARKVLAQRYRGELVGSTDTDASNATQILALARSSLGQGDAPVRQFKQDGARGHGAKGKEPLAAGAAPTVEQLMGIERSIGALLDTIRSLITRLGMASDLNPAYGARTTRVMLLSDADAKTRTEWLPVLQFQHTQLLTIAPKIAPIVQQLQPIKFMPAVTLDAAKRQQRAQLERTITAMVQAAAVSHLRDESTSILRGIVDAERAAEQDRLDAAQVDLDEGTREAISTPQGSVRGAREAGQRIAQQRQDTLNAKTVGKSPYEQQKAITQAGAVALSSRMRAAEHGLEQLRAAALEVFGDPEALRKLVPKAKAWPEVILDVKDHLADVQRAWDAGERDGTPAVQSDPNAPDDWAEWQGKAAGLKAAREAFAKIAGDQSLVDFFNQVRSKIADQRIINAVVSFAATLLITLGTGMAAAALGARAAGMLATEASSLAARGFAFAVDVSINASINSIVQLAQADTQQGSFGWVMLENTLMEMFTRGLMKPLRDAEQTARLQAHQLAQLPHLAPAERRVLMAVDVAGRNVIVEMVGNMATQWTAHRLVQVFHKDPQQVSEAFALTVLQQGAAIGLGKFFHGRLEGWKKYRAALAKTRVGGLPEAAALFAARDEFFALAEHLANSPSPNPAEATRLLELHNTLLAQERALFEGGLQQGAHAAPHPAGSREVAPHAGAGDAPVHAVAPASKRSGGGDGPDNTPHPATDNATGEIAHRGLMFAASVGNATYERGGFFRIGTADGSLLVEVQRSSRDEPHLRRKGEHVILEIPRGLTDVELERAVVGKLTELQHQELRRARGEKATAASGLGKKGTGERLSPADMGHVAELRVLRERAAEQDARGAAGHEQGAALRAEISRLEERLGLSGDSENAQRRRHAVEVQVAVQGDATRRARVAKELNGERGHPGLELHNHFNGIVQAEVFRQRAATADGGKDTGSWIPLLERIASFRGKEFEHAHKDGTITTRATAGDAVRIAKEARRQVHELLGRANDLDVSDVDRGAFRRAAEAVATEAGRVALVASPETDFNSAYEVRDQLVKETFGGEAKPGERADVAKQRAYDDYIREAILQLAADGVGYSEQSISVKKLGGVLSPERIEMVIQQLIAEGKIAPGEIDIRVLGMLHTAQFGERDADLPSVETPERSEPALKRDTRSTKRQMGKPGVVGRDIAGPEQLHFDERGGEALENLYYQDLAEAKRTGTSKILRPHVGEGAVDSIEGKSFHTDKDRVISREGEPSHYARSRSNIDVVLAALERIHAKGGLDSSKVIVRFGHVTHATPAQAARMAKLGVVAEVNLGSNVASGAVSQTEGVHGKRASVEQLDEHSFATLLYYNVSIVLNTDAGGVMSTSLRIEYQRARQAIEDVLAGARPIRVQSNDAQVELSAADQPARMRGREVPGRPDLRELGIGDLTPFERDRFLHGYEKLYADAESYYLRRPKPRGATGNPTTAAAPFGGAHHIKLASDHGLIPSKGTALLEGSGSDVKAAARAYRRGSYGVTETELAGGVVVVEVRSSDGDFHMTLRSWAGDAPGYLPVHDASALDRPKTGKEVRSWYKEQVKRVSALNQDWVTSGVPLAERARRAYEVRRHARLAAREQMQSSGDVQSLSARDLLEYGQTDGPTFEQLVDQQVASGTTLEQAYESIIDSSQRSNKRYDQKHGGAGNKT